MSVKFLLGSPVSKQGQGPFSLLWSTPSILSRGYHVPLPQGRNCWSI